MHNLFEVEIHHLYDVTTYDEPFYIYDSGNNNLDRLIMYSTIENLWLLVVNNIIFFNRTLKAVPRHIIQLYIIHGIYTDNVFPLVYWLTAYINVQT